MEPETEVTQPTAVDGRSQRRERNVNRALDAVVELAFDGNLDPSWAEVAERAGLSYRSLYRYFDDRTSLLWATIGRAMESVESMMEVPSLGEGALDKRIDDFVTARVDSYEAYAPIARTAYRRAAIDVVSEGLAQIRIRFRAQLEDQFAPEFEMLNYSERARTITLIDIAFQFDALEYLCEALDHNHESFVDALTTHLWLHLGPLDQRRRGTR